MDRSIRKDIARRYGKIVGNYKDLPSEAVGCYVCSQCGQVVKTRQVDAGVVPMGIECPYCHGDSFFTEDSYPNIGVTHEWYRPALDEVLAMTEGRLFTVNFVLSGGLLRRECSRD